MTMDEYLRLEAAAQRRHRRLGAALYASGLPYSNHLQDNEDLIGFDDIHTSYSDPVTNPPEPDYNMGNSIGSSTETPSNPGYTNDPESQNGFEPVKYTDDPYNINGDRLNHSKPMNVGLAVSLPLSQHMFVESGLYWSYLRSSSYRITNQSLHFIGVPLKLGYRLDGPGRTSLSLSAGAKAEKCVSATRTYLSGNTTRLHEPGLQFAAVGSAALQYDFTPRLGIFIAPELSYWFTKTGLPTYNTENPFNLSLKAGLNLAQEVNARAATPEQMQDLRDLYRSEVIGFSKPQDCFRSLLASRGEAGLKDAISFLLAGCGADLAASNPSMDPVQLRRILLDLQCVDVLQTVLGDLDKLGARMQQQFGEACRLTGQQMTGRVLDFTEQAFVTAAGIGAFVGECGMQALLAQMDFTRELVGLFRRLSPRLFGKETDRERLVGAAQEHLDGLISLEEEAEQEKQESSA